MRQPDQEYEIPLWEVNHSKYRLLQEEQMDFVAYRLGYEMEEEVDDPTNKAYKPFSDEPYPVGCVVDDIDFDRSKPVWLCADFNRKPHCWCLMQIQDNGAYLFFDELPSKEATTIEQSRKAVSLLVKWGISHVLLVGDNTSNQRAGNYGRVGKNDWEYVKEELTAGNIIWDSKHLAVQNPKRKIRVDKVNNVIHNKKLLIHKRCQWLIKDYRFSIVDEKGLKVDNGDRGHMSDASDYGIWANEKGSRGVTFYF